MRHLSRIELERGSRVELLYVCPNALVRYMPTCIDMSCAVIDEPYRDFNFSPRDMIQLCPMHTSDGHTCYKYKKEETMKPVEARRFGDNSVAVNDIVEIKLGHSFIDNALYQYLGNKRTIVGRVVSFETYAIVLDVSERFKQKQFDICYDHIIEIKDVTKEMITP
jgi:hypothetical protein